MKYLLIYPLIESASAGRKVEVKIPTVPPLGLLYIAKTLEKHRHNVEIIDFTAESIDKQTLEKAVHNADVIGITVLTISVQKVKELIQQIRFIESDKPIIVGGPHCSLYPEQSLKELDADISVEGDGEHVIVEISEVLEGKKPLDDVPGICFKNDKNKIQKASPAIIIDDLDGLSFPARHLVKKYRYGQIVIPNLKTEQFTSIITSRGCPHKCRYCTRHFLGMKRYRLRSIENVIRELKEIYNQGYKYVVIADDSFLSHPKRAYQIMDRIIQENLHFNIFLQGTRVDTADEALYLKMKEAGVKSIGFGLESGNQDVLDFYNKGITIDQIQKAVYLSRKMGFFTLGSFILGAPFETKEHFERTIRFAYSLPLDAVTFLTLEYRAGSDIWKEAVNQGKIRSDEYTVKSDVNRGLSFFTKEELDSTVKKAQRNFYLRPSYLCDEFIQAVIKKDFTFIKAGINFIRMA